jgi:predicted DNA-binding transcriptional regulator YafY
MRGDQLIRRWRVIRAIEASPNGLTVTEIAQREETGIRTIYRNLDALQTAGFRYPCHAKAQRAPKEIFRLLLSFLDIFLTPSHSIRKTIKGFSARPPLRSLCLGVRGLDNFMSHSSKVMHGELHTVRVRISPGWARWVGEKIWHESQKITKLPNGSLEITFQVAGLEKIKRWVLSFDPEPVVLEPEKLKEIFRKDLSESMTNYPVSHLSMKMEGIKSAFLMN